MENSNILVKSAVMATVVIIMIATLLSPVITDAAYNHIVQSNDGATDGVDLGYYTPQEGKTSVEVYPDTVTVTADGGTVTIAYPSATKTITGDAILAIGGGTAPSADDLNLYVKNGKLYTSGVECSSCTIRCVDNTNLGSLYIDLVLTGAKTTHLTPLVDWACLPTLGGAFGSYTGNLAYELSDVVSVGDFAGVYIAAKGTDIISNNEYDLGATIERDTDGNITGVKYAKATEEAAAVDGSASAYTGEDPVILTPDDDDGTVAVVTPEEWDGEDAAASITYTPKGTLVNGIYFTISGSVAAVEYTEDRNATSIIVPDTVEISGSTYAVTTISSGAFQNMAALKNVTLPDGLTAIGNYAFESCTSLALTSLPAGLTSIGYNAFGSCTSLALTSLPAGLTSVALLTFDGCTSLALTSLPDGITSIGNSAFKGCTSLALTSLPAGLTTIDNDTFNGCTSLALTSLPAGLTTIPPRAFMGCTSLALTSLPDGITSIGGFAFKGCTSMSGIVIPSSPTINNSALPETLAEVLNLGSTTLTTAMGITDNTVVSDSIQSLAIIQQKSADYYEEKGSEYTLLLIIPVLMIVALLYAVVSASRTKMS